MTRLELLFLSSLIFSESLVAFAFTTKSTLSSNRRFSSLQSSKECDILVLGSGPAARAISSLMGAQDFNVIMADQNHKRPWPPNYGVWQDEWQAVLERYENAGVPLGGGKVGMAVDRAWDVTDCYFGGSFDVPMTERTRIDRPYYRVDKHALKDSLTTDTYSILEANHVSTAIGTNLYAPTDSLVHDADGTTITLVKKDDTPVTVRTKLVIDCTGHESKLVLKETRPESSKPGFQIAYGCVVNVDESKSTDLSQIGPYDKEAMTLFDYRTDHFNTDESLRKAEKAPTFMYAMPLQKNEIFFEETSLVARPAISFQECKDRCFRRLEHLGIDWTDITEEEFCYIPMGGALPAKDQRVIALGGSASMVHASTGYHICRCLVGATDMAKVLTKELKSDVNLDRAAAAAYHAIWTPENQRQRQFTVFGGEYLMKQNVVGLRGFFGGFFRLPQPLWAGFLAGWPGLPNNNQHESWLARMNFGVNFLARLPFSVAADMTLSIVGYMVQTGPPLIQSVTPFLGEPSSYEYGLNLDRLGDVAAKEEARAMLSASAVTEHVPVDFGESSKSGEGDEKSETAKEKASPPKAETAAAPKAEVKESPKAAEPTETISEATSEEEESEESAEAFQ